MNKNTENKSSAETLRQKAEDLLKKKSEAKILELIEELAFQNEEKAKRAEELVIANKELAFQNEEKAKRAEELIIANKELAFQNEEKAKRAEELVIANKELAFQNEEKAKRAEELIIANAHALKLTHELEVHQIELKMQNEELLAARSEAVASAKKHLELYDLAPSGYFTLSRKGEIIGLNLTGAMMLGKERLYLQNAKFDFFVSADTIHDYILFLEKAFSTKTKESCEITLTTSSNKSLYVHLSGIVAKNGTQCMVTAVDITERRHVEKKLDDIIDKNPMSIQILNIEGYTIKTNSAHLNLFGAVVPQGYSLFQDPQLVQQGFGTYFDRIINGEVVSFPDSYFNARDVDPSFPDIPITIKALGFPLTDSNGITEEIVLMQENITERKHAQQKLQASEERYRSIFQGSPLGILIADAETKKITYANSAQCHAFGFTEEQFKTMSIADIHPLETFGHTLAEFESMLNGEKALAENIQCLKRNGEIFYSDISGALILLNGKSQLLGFFKDISERRQAEKALKASEEKYRNDLIFLQSILESPIAIVIFSIDKNYCYTNFSLSHKETMKKIWGVDIQPGMNMVDLISNLEDREKAKNNFDRAYKGDSFILEEEYGEKELARNYYDNYYSPVKDAEGEIVGVSVFVLDVSQRRQAELRIIELNTNLEKTVNNRTAQFKEALNRLEKIADRVPGVVYQFQMKPDGTVCFPFASKGIRDIFRVSPEEAAHDASIIFTRIHPADSDGVLASIQASAKDNTLWKHEYRVKFDDGTVRWLSGNAQPQAEADGTILWHGYISDITERKQAEDNLKESTERHRGLSEAAFDSIFFSEKGICIEQNQMAEKIFGYTNQEAIGRYGTDWIVEADRKMVMDNMLAGLEEPYEVTAIRKNGTTFPCMLSGRMMHYKGRTVRVTSLSDITQRKQAEVALIKAKTEAEKANLAKSEFLSRMSHELRTPMNSILGFAQLMEMGGELSPKHNKSVNHILNNGRHLLNLINEVLDISGIEAGRVPLTFVPVQLSRIIGEAIDTVHPSARAMNVKLEFVNMDPARLFVKADPHRLQQVLLNLINNAIKYNREGGSVIIKTELQQAIAPAMSFARISVSDTGTGINPEYFEKLFMPFERIGAEKTRIEGTGLGLMIVKKLIVAMGGSVGVDSVQGVGSTFWFELPHSEDQQTEAWQTEHKSVPLAMVTEKTGTILYIEDNASNTELVEQILLYHRSAIRFLNTAKGAQTVPLAIEYAPDLILLDLDLPDVQGFEVIKVLNADEKTREIPVVVISADAMPHQIEKLMQAGSKDYLTKPLDIRAFLQVVDTWVKK